jgi:hypothetical protein
MTPNLRIFRVGGMAVQHSRSSMGGQQGETGSVSQQEPQRTIRFPDDESSQSVNFPDEQAQTTNPIADEVPAVRQVC